MQLLPVDLIGLVGAVMGISVVLIPVAGFTLRYALKPIVGVVAQYLETRGSEESVKIVERRLNLLEQQLDDVQGSLRRLVEVSEFDASLRGGAGREALPAAAEDAEDESDPQADDE